MTLETQNNVAEWAATSEGWCKGERPAQMCQLVVDTQPKVVVEIGVFAGGSLIPQALGLKENGFGRIFGIDPWSRRAALDQIFVANPETPAEDEAIARKWWAEVDLNRMHQLCMEGIWRYGLDHHAVIIRAESQDCPDLFEQIDILYIDGSHSEEASCRDVEMYLPRVRPTGHVWFDDAHWTSTQKAIHMIEDFCDLVKDYESYRLYQARP
jgi:predicted O-methyltransferase YrrM